MTQTVQGLTDRQQAALDRLRGLRVPAAPPLRAEALTDAPWWYSRRSQAALAVLLCLVVMSVIRVPLPGGGATLRLEREARSLALPGGQGTLILQGPADLEMRHARRRLLSGRLETDLLLRTGDLLLQADPRVPKRILIHTPLVSVRVTGTQVLVGHRPESGSRVLVIRGRVETKPPAAPRWEPLGSGTELTVRPDGLLLRNTIQPAFNASDVRAQGAPPGAPDAPSTDVHRLLWHEQE